MKKRVILLCLIAIFAINLACAGYECSSGDIKEEQEVIAVGGIEYPNKVGVGAIESGDRAFSADILIDAKRITLTNDSSSETVDILSGSYDVVLANITGSLVGVKIKGSGGGLNKGETKKVGDLYAYLIDVSGTYPGENAHVKLMVGIDNLFLYTNNPTSKKTIGGKEYLFELFGSFTDSVAITVRKCENGSLVETAGTPSENTTSTNLTTTNATNAENQSTTSNITTNITQENTANQTQNITGDSESKEGFFESSSLIMVVSTTIIILIVFLVLYLRNRIAEPS